MLPESYRRLLYIENATPGSYIDTGLIASYDMRIVIDGYVLEGDTALIGARTAVSCSDIFTLQFTSEKTYRFSFGSSRISATKDYAAGKRYTFDLSKDGLTIDDELIGVPTTRALTGVLPLYLLGALNTGGVASSFGITRIYSAKIYRDDELIADYIPCVSEEGIYGIYDNVMGTFLSNAGDGSLTGMLEPFVGITISKLPDKLIYNKGEKLDITGMVVEEYTESGYRTEVTGYTVSGFDSSVVGTEAITVTYDGLSTTYAVIINDTPISDLIVTVEDMKQYLRVDHDDDDSLIEYLIKASEDRCMDIAREETRESFEALENAKISVMYAVAFQYEHREDLNQNDLNLSLRALLFGERKVEF